MNRKYMTSLVATLLVATTLAADVVIDEKLHDFSFQKAERLIEKSSKTKREKRGPRGVVGEIGPMGPRGMPGLPGKNGLNGRDGKDGAPGATGPKGEKGPQGERGPQGPVGPQGERGHAGKDGVDGKHGERGPRGEKGEKGDPGSTVLPLSTDLFVDGCTSVPKCIQDGSIEKPFSSLQAAINRATHLESCSAGCHVNCQVITILIASGIYNCDSDCDDSNLFIELGGATKLSLIGLGPVTLGCVSGCACQPLNHPDVVEDSIVGILWVPNPGTTPKGVRPTLTITTINTINDSITPYQSYSNKFRITGDIVICNSSPCTPSSCVVCPDECPVVNNSEASSSSSSSSSSEPAPKKAKTLHQLAPSQIGKKSAQQINGNDDPCTLCSPGLLCCSCGISSICPCGENKCPDEDFGSCCRTPTDGPSISLPVVCCATNPEYTPAELSLNAEVFGSVNVTGVVMLYFYKARIHGLVHAPDSDIVIAERSRFDSSMSFHFYGTFTGCEILNGFTLTGFHLWDQSSSSIRLQGFFSTFVAGVLCSEGGSKIRMDVTTYAYVLQNDAALCPFPDPNIGGGFGCISVIFPSCPQVLPGCEFNCVFP